MRALVVIANVILLVLWLRRRGWTYYALCALWPLYFPLSAGFKLHAPVCSLRFNASLAVFSLSNTPHIVLFGLFYLFSFVQFRNSKWRYGWAALATVIMGALLEIAEGIGGEHHCRLRDLVPDSAGAMIGAALVLAWSSIRAGTRLKTEIGD